MLRGNVEALALARQVTCVCCASPRRRGSRRCRAYSGTSPRGDATGKRRSASPSWMDNGKGSTDHRPAHRLGWVYLTQGDLEAAIGCRGGLALCHARHHAPYGPSLGAWVRRTPIRDVSAGPRAVRGGAPDDLRTGRLGSSYVIHLRSSARLSFYRDA